MISPTEPVLITRTPVRITFFGGGTDYPEYYLEHGGKTIGASINKYSYVVLRKLADIDPIRYRLIYAKSELCNEIGEIEQPVIRECLNETGHTEPTEIHYFADLPSFSGLGTSSSFAVGLLNGLFTKNGLRLSKQELAERAFRVERERLNEIVGVQDQFTCSFGGMVRLDMDGDGVRRSEVSISPERRAELDDRLLMFFTGRTRYAHGVLGEQIEKTKNGSINASLKDLASLVDEGTSVLAGRGDLNEFGRLLDQAWQIKRGLSSAVSNERIDEIYQAARSAGATGGKLMGAGTGGFFLFYVPPHSRQRVLEAINPLKHVPFSFEDTGTTLMHLVPGDEDEVSVPSTELRRVKAVSQPAR